MRRRLPPLNALRSFEAVGRQLSVTLAARELNVTEPAVSRAVKSLEDHFGVQLFLRNPGGLELTPQGRALLPAVTQSLDTIAAAAQNIYPGKRQILRILATPFIGARWLPLRLGMFVERFPDIDPHMHNSFRFEEVFRSSFDVAIWYGGCELKGHNREVLFNWSRIPVCSPEYAERVGGIQAVEDLEKCTLLHEFDYSDWTRWFEAAGVTSINATTGLITDNYESLISTAISGGGVALTFSPAHETLIAGDSLVAPLGEDIGLDTEYIIFWRSEADNPAVEAFVTFLLDTLDEST